MLIYYVFTPDSVFKSIQPNELTWQTIMFYSDIVPLIYVNKTICMVICHSTRFKSIFMAQDDPSGADIIPKYLLRMRGLVPSFKTFLSLINRLLVTI